jgi:hypothetical protein
MEVFDEGRRFGENRSDLRNELPKVLTELDGIVQYGEDVVCEVEKGQSITDISVDPGDDYEYLGNWAVDDVNRRIGQFESLVDLVQLHCRFGGLDSWINLYVGHSELDLRYESCWMTVLTVQTIAENIVLVILRSTSRPSEAQPPDGIICFLRKRSIKHW